MLDLVFLTVVVIVFVIYLTKRLLDVEKESGRERITELLNTINREKTRSEEFEIEQVQLEKKEKNTNNKILQIRLELLEVEVDLNEIIPKLLN